MQVLKKITKIGKQTITRSFSHLQHKILLHQPTSRLQKIRKNKITYPASTSNRLVFISNLEGIGFRRMAPCRCPASIKLEDMLSQININCYKQWQRNKQRSESNPFARLDWITNLSMVLMSILAIIYYILDLNHDSVQIEYVLYIFFAFVIITVAVSLTAYCKDSNEEDCELKTIKNIKADLEKLNTQEIQLTQQRPRFIWQYHNECIWIALNILSFDDE